eukprot:Nitzschia sp. Nitz4//scaffold84_size84139//30119//32022//NITZ4_005194-RA/size84139-snap-gene-0.120-mRNA-1//-1//CDS//3329559021//8629//frame0
MSSSQSATAGVALASCATIAALFTANKMFNKKSPPLPLLLSSAQDHPQVLKVLKSELANLSGDSVVKIVRQLDFWIKERLPEAELVALTQRLVHTATWQSRMGSFQVPKVRFGRTELQMPIITCGAMRFQHTWMPDSMPIAISKKKVIQTPSQENIINIVRQCLKMGINHFETARMYGTSEIQLSHALATMIETGEIKRSDFILQTKLPVRPREGFEKLWEQSWAHLEKLEYIDLLSFWVVSKDDQVELVLSDAEDGIMALALDWKKQGKVKHIGFSTHGTAENVYKLVSSNKFDYVNVHNHYFGDYHAEGTSDTLGGQGNLASVKKALELDMGVFNISPIDKGGRLYQPSSQVARTIGADMTPITFACLHSWIVDKMQTVSIGFARPEDLAEVLEAAEFFTKTAEATQKVKEATARLDQLAETNLGKDWLEKGLLNVPSPFRETSDGIALGHTLWIYNMLHAFGMYDTAKARYGMLAGETKKWSKKKTFQENIKDMAPGNPMRSYDGSVALGELLKDHFNPALAEERILEVTDLFKGEPLSAAERTEKGWDMAYDLRPWHEFPDTERVSPKAVVLQNLTAGWFGAGGGPTAESVDLGEFLKSKIADSA